MKRITNLITHGLEFILARTQPEDAFSKLGKYVAVNAEHITDGATNRPLTGLDVLTADTLADLAKHCDRFARHTEWMKTHPMPAVDSPNFKTWLEIDFAQWAKHTLNA